jgi:hypothetical protein
VYDWWINAVAILLVSSAVLAELNLLRMFIQERRAGRKEDKQSCPCRETRSQESTTSSRWAFTRVVAASVAALAAAPSRAQTQESTEPAARATDPGTLLFGEPRLTFSPRPLSDSQPQTNPTAATQPLTISTNRPSFNDTTGIVPIGHFQLETGYTFTFRDRDGLETQTHNAPELLGRIPLLEDRLELQLGTSGYVWSRTDSGSGFDSTEGLSDMTVGLRFKVTDQDHWLPRIALQATTTTGLGTDGISNQDVEPTFKLIWSYDLGDGWGVYGNLGVGYLTSGSDRFTQSQAGFCLTKTLSDKWAVYGEYYVFGPAGKGADAAHYVDFGAAYLITPRVQLDGRVGFGLGDEANSVFTGFGVSFLF